MADSLHCSRCFAVLKKLAPLRQFSGLFRKTSTFAPVRPNGEYIAADEKHPSAVFPLLSSLRRSYRYASLLDLQAPCIQIFLISLKIFNKVVVAQVFKLTSHVKAPNKAGSSGVLGIKLFEYAKSAATEDEFFSPPD